MVNCDATLVIIGRWLARWLAVAAFAYIVAYIYRDTTHQEDLELVPLGGTNTRAWRTHSYNPVLRVPKVFTSLSLALYQILVTIMIVDIFLLIGWFLGQTVIFMEATVLGSTWVEYIMSLLFDIPELMLKILPPVVAAIEPENYGRSALKRSFKFIRSRAVLFLG